MILMHPSTRRRGALLLLLAVFHAAYGIQLLNPTSAGIPYFNGSPHFTSIDTSEVQYATNTSNTILRIGGSYYLWRDGVWFRSSSAAGIYWKIDTLPAELAASQPNATE